MKKLIGLYKTEVAATKAQELMMERGIPARRISRLAPDSDVGVRLASYAGHNAAPVAWKWGAIAGLVLAATLGIGASGELTLVGLITVPGMVAGALAGFAIGLTVFGIVGAVIGRRQYRLQADFFTPDERRGAVALGAVLETDEEIEHARYAYRSTGALETQAGEDWSDAKDPRGTPAAATVNG